MNFCSINALGLALFMLAGVAQAEASDPAREYGIGMNLDVGRGWGSGDASNSLSASANVLFLQEHFHIGPALSYSRFYSGPASSYSLGGGVTAKWTLENLQTATQTPFAVISGYYRTYQYSSTYKSKSKDTFASLGVGYETFLNSFVSIAPSLQWSKSWTVDSYDDDWDVFGDGKDQHSSYSQAFMQLDLNVYL